MINRLTWQSMDDNKGFDAICRNEERQASVSDHTHDFYEIVYVVDGFCLHRCNQTSSLLMAGDLLALRPGDVHTYRARQYVNIINFLFMPRALGNVMQEVLQLPGMADFFGGTQIGEWRLHRHLSLVDREYVQSFMREMVQERQELRPGWMLRSKALMLDFMVVFARLFETGIQVQRDDTPYLGYVTATMAKVESCYHEDLTVGQMARELGISPDHLTRQFRQALGVTPVEYLRRYRFARALEMLRHGEPIGDVCHQVGFHHLSHFSREFKVLFGMTPSMFRRQSGERQKKERSQ